jgi:hypothetical protein
MPNRWLGRPERWAFVLVAFVLGSVPARAQDVALTPASELGFRRFMRAAESGELGSDVTGANVGIAPHRVQVELVRPGQANKLLFLTHKSSKPGPARYFDIELGQAATASDAARVARILDAAFEEDPFEVVVGFVGAHAPSHFPTLTEAWKEGGWAEVLWALDGRLTAPVGVTDAAVVAAALAVAVLASLILLWGSTP